ncbi:MAG: glycosyltransferase family 1 protein [Candidatus Shapirobacteria bacterium]|jgi:glycosyltransferase involved in cell wall biosynthesis
MKHIVIDARLYGPKHTGIGRYTKNLLKFLTLQSDFSEFKFTLIVYPELVTEIKKDLGKKFNYISTNIRHYSLKEQFCLPFIIYKLKPDLIHFVHFNKPMFYMGKSVVTIHDLIKHFFKGRLNTTKISIVYWIKHLSYLMLTNSVIKNNEIIVPSDFWRDYLIKNFHVKPKKITTTHEAVDPTFISKTNQLKTPSSLLNRTPYIIYTGNLYPHKNVKVIIEALKLLPDIKLKIICARNFFTEKVEKLVNKYNLKSQVEFLGYIPDQEFRNIYFNALALVHPSFMEGFSLTGLEAMALNCPVISSNSSCLPEIYQDSVLYFDPNNSNDLVNQIKKLKASPKLREKLIKLGHLQVNKYSWNSTAQKTFTVYKNILNDNRT